MTNYRYRMPTVFGPSCGPRSGPEGRRFDYSNSSRTVASVTFLTDEKMLAGLLPKRFVLAGEPRVTVEWTALRDLEWLAGRGYHMLGIKYQAQFNGQHDVARGPFLSVLWEDRPEPIITGREELGFAKLYCELPEPRDEADRKTIEASWDGHTFLRMHLKDLEESTPPAPPAPAAAGAPIAGMLHHRYLPRVSCPGEADIEQAVVTPAGGYEVSYQSYRTGRGRVEFVPTRWEQMPTMYHIVNALAALPVLQIEGAVWFESTGSKDLHDQRVLS
mgnify:CR=1 FL=1